MSDVTPKPVLILAQNIAGNPSPIEVDQNGVVQVSPPIDRNGNIASVAVMNGNSFVLTENGLIVGSILYANNADGSGFDALNENGATADNQIPDPQGNLVVNSYAWGYNGTNFDRVRLATIYKSVAATAAGNTIVWTPAAGKRFRLMGYTLSIAGTLAVTAVELVKLTDTAGGSVIAQHNATVTSATPTGDTQIGSDLGQGFLSAAPNNVLNINLSAALTTGSVIVNAWGTEE